MADLIRTKCGRIQNMFENMTLTAGYIGCYKSLFSPVALKTAILSVFQWGIIRRYLFILDYHIFNKPNSNKRIISWLLSMNQN